MKKLMLLFALIGFFTQVQAQKIIEKDIPEAVILAFNERHSYLKVVDWYKYGLNYEATYEVDRMDKSLTYDTWGKLVETKIEIMAFDLPVPAMVYVLRNYKGHPIKKSFKVINEMDKVTYQVKAEGIDLTFNAKGDFINSIKM